MASPHLATTDGDCRGRYRAAFQRARQRAADGWARLNEERSGESLLAELTAYPIEVRLDRLRADRRFHSLALWRTLMDRHRRRLLSDPEAASEAASFAAAVAEHLDGDRLGHAYCYDCRVHAATAVAAARFELGDLSGAEAALADGAEHLARGSGDPLLHAELLTVKAQVLEAAAQHNESVPLLDRAFQLYRQVESHHLAGVAAVRKGLLLHYAGQPEDARASLSRGLSLLDAERSPELAAEARRLIGYPADDGPPLSAVGEPERPPATGRHSGVA
jgi:hypothetical protein